MNKPLPIVLSKFAKTFLKGVVLFMVFFTVGVVIGNSVVKAEGEPTYQRPAWCAEGFACVTKENLEEFYDGAFKQGSENGFQQGRADIIKWVMARCSTADLIPFYMEMTDTGQVWFECKFKPETVEPEGTWL